MKIWAPRFAVPLTSMGALARDISAAPNVQPNPERNADFLGLDLPLGPKQLRRLHSSSYLTKSLTIRLVALRDGMVSGVPGVSWRWDFPVSGEFIPSEWIEGRVRLEF